MNKKNQVTIRAVGMVDQQNQTVTHIVNTKTLDRYRSIVLPKGAKIANYLKNPIVLWGHDGKEVPIGKCIDIQITADVVQCTTKFNEKDEFAMKVFNAYADGYLSGWSIGFIPKAEKVMEATDIVAHNLPINEMDLTGREVLITEWEMLEYSAVSIPANPEALKELQMRGLIEDKMETREVEVKIEEPIVEVKAEEVKPEPIAEVVVVVEPVVEVKEVVAEVVPEPVVVEPVVEVKEVEIPKPEVKVEEKQVLSSDDVLVKMELAFGDYERIIDEQISSIRKELSITQVQLNSVINSGKEKDEVIRALEVKLAELEKSDKFSNVEKIRRMEANKGKEAEASFWFKKL